MFGSEPMFVHILTLSFGLIIAYGLLQLIEIFQRRSRERKARQANKTDVEAPNSPKPPHNT